MSITQKEDFEIKELETPIDQLDSPENTKFQEIRIGNRKLFNCLYPDCQKTFKFRSEIKRHLTIHYNERPFTCSFFGCDKAFKRADALANHQRIHTKSTPFECPVFSCGAKFTTKSALNYHVLRHSGEKKFVCSYPGCSKAFITYAQLKQHEKAFYYHQKSNSAPEREQDLSPNNRLYFLEKISLLPNKEIHIDENQSACPFYSIEKPTYFHEICSPSTQFSYNPSDLIIQKEETAASSGSELSSVSSDRKREDKSLINLLDFVIGENKALKKTLKEALELLQTIRQKESKDVDLFFKSSIDFEEDIFQDKLPSPHY